MTGATVTPSDAPRGPIAWMARNHIAANLMMVILLAGGVWTAVRMQKEVFPAFQLDVVEVEVRYPGAAPAEVEQGILLPVEEAVRGIQGIRELTSEAREEQGTVTIELVGGADRMRAFQDIDQAVNRIRTFPDAIEEPEVRLLADQREVMQIALYGEVDVWTLRKLTEQLRDHLLSDPRITQVELGNIPDYVTHVEIPRERLRQYGMTLGDVARIIERSSEDVAAGAVETSKGEILLRMKERKQWARQFAEIEIVATPDGGRVLLGDVATVTDGFEEAGFHSRFDLQPSIDLEIYRIGTQSPLEIAAAVKTIMAEFETTLPPGVQWRIDGDSARDFRERLALLIENGWMAILIVIVILALFLELRLAFWVMMGMATSFIGGLIVLPLVGVSINMVSMFGFLVVLGIVVDDAIVVGENIHEKRLQGLEGERAAIEGVEEIATPVTFSILTNIVAFIPLLFIPGTTGKFWWPLPAVVIAVLTMSLFEALFILPAHLNHTPRPPRTWLGRAATGVQQRFARGFDWLVQTLFRPVLAFALRLRYVSICVALAILAIVGGYGYSGHMGMIMMPEVAADEIEAGVRLPVGTTVDQASAVALDVTRSTQRMFEDHDLHRVAEGIKTNVRRGNFIDVEIVMKRPDEREVPMTARDVIALWRDELGDLPGVRQVSFEAERGPGGWRQDIAIDISHSDTEVLARAARDFLERVEAFAETRDVSDNYNTGKAQLDFVLRPEGRAMGLTPADVGMQVRDAFYGALALRTLRGTNEIEVRVKLPREQRKNLYHLEQLIIRCPDGAEVPLTEVVDIRRGEAFTSINRRDGRRAITVSCDVEPKRAIGRVMAALRDEVLPGLRADYPGITWTFQGSQAEMRESTQVLWGGFGLALAVMYALLAVAFRSYVQPLIVLLAIPFGIVGAVIGHILLGYDLSLISLMGVIALSGVVVNDSLIMLDHANRLRLRDPAAGAYHAILEAGVRRFRPIALTTMTTFGGLTPIIFETSLQAQYLIPMAISLGFGIVFATGIILILVPCLYLVMEDLTPQPLVDADG